MDSSHQTLKDAKVIVDNLGQGGQTVGGATGIGDNFHVRAEIISKRSKIFHAFTLEVTRGHFEVITHSVEIFLSLRFYVKSPILKHFEVLSFTFYEYLHFLKADIGLIAKKWYF